MKQRKGYIGQKFGRLTIVEESRGKWRHYYAVTVCDCGQRKTIPTNDLTSGRTRSRGSTS